MRGDCDQTNRTGTTKEQPVLLIFSERRTGARDAIDDTFTHNDSYKAVACPFITCNAEILLLPLSPATRLAIVTGGH